MLYFRICVINTVQIGLLAIADQSDLTYAFANVVIFSGIETCFGLIAACLPTLKPIYTHFLAGPTSSLPSEQGARVYKRTHSQILDSNELGPGLELDTLDTNRTGQNTGSSELHLATQDDDKGPLK